MEQQKPVGVISFGLGPIGRETAKRVIEASDLHLVGAVEINPELVGRTLREVIGPTASAHLDVSSTVAEACELASNRLDGPSPLVVLHCTGSRFPKEIERIRQCLALGLNVVSSCEELAAPELGWPELAHALVGEATSRGVTVVATGVNPGFVMDRLPLVAASMSRHLERLEVRRVVDVSTRRPQLQRKVGAGITPEVFEANRRSATIGHVGLAESLACLAKGLGRPVTLEDIEESLEPVIAERRLQSALGPIEPGLVAGIYQSVATRGEGRPHLKLELTIAVGAHPPEDTVVLEGDPSFSLSVPGGLDGDPATCAALVNSIPKALNSPAGLITPAEMVDPRPPQELWTR